MGRHGMQVTDLQPHTSAYTAFTTALAPLAKAQEAKFAPALVQQILDAQR